MTSLADYIAAAHVSPKKLGTDIRERWQDRIVARGLHTQGMSGAQTYLDAYGKGIKPPKVIALALMAESAGCQEMAMGFWIAAHTLAGYAASPAEIAALTGGATPTPPPAPPTTERLGDFPDHLQPGSIATQQPTDAKQDRQAYITDPNYAGQPKRDGNRLVILATVGSVSYQTRSRTVRPSPGAAFDHAFQQMAKASGSTILDGELVYLDALGGEHRTAAQAATANIERGDPTAPVITQISVFKALFAGRLDLTVLSERERLTHGAVRARLAAKHLAASGTERVEAVPTAFTTEAKTALASQQERDGREGEVWIDLRASYRGGKRMDHEDIVRTKYTQETTVTVSALTRSTDPSRPFGAITVAESDGNGNLREVGTVGTGFSRAEAEMIADAHAKAPGQVRIVVRHQGRTESGVLWLARFDSLAA